jgi:hypothetical protein
MPVVLEFRTGGSLSHVACAPSCIQSRLIEAGISTTMAYIERLAGTTLADGTGFPGCLRALAAFNVGASETSAIEPGYVMNPMLPDVVPIVGFAAYFRARQMGVDAIVMDDPEPVPPPAPVPHPPSTEDAAMPLLGQFIARTTTGQLAYFISDGMRFRHVLNPTDEAGVSATGPWFNGGQPLRLWSPNPVADAAAFGVPADAATAALLGLSFP